MLNELTKMEMEMRMRMETEMIMPMILIMSTIMTMIVLMIMPMLMITAGTVLPFISCICIRLTHLIADCKSFGQS